jgi:hypothetical protein
MQHGSNAKGIATADDTPSGGKKHPAALDGVKFREEAALGNHESTTGRSYRDSAVQVVNGFLVPRRRNEIQELGGYVAVAIVPGSPPRQQADLA